MVSLTSELLCHILRPLDSRTRTTTSTRFDLKFFRVFSKYRLPVIDLPFFTRKVSIVIFSEGGYTLSRTQNDKTFNICYIAFASTTFALKLAVE